MLPPDCLALLFVVAAVFGWCAIDVFMPVNPDGAYSDDELEDGE